MNKSLRAILKEEIIKLMLGFSFFFIILTYSGIVSLVKFFNLQYYGECGNAVVIRLNTHKEPTVHYEFALEDKILLGKTTIDLSQIESVKKGDSIRIVYAPSGLKMTYEEYLERKKQNEETLLKYPVSVVRLIYRIIKRPGDVVFPENQEF